MSIRAYLVRFYTTKGGSRMWVINVMATSQKTAVEKVRTLWEQDQDRKGHQFRIEARRLVEGEEFLFNYFSCVGDDWNRERYNLYWGHCTPVKKYDVSYTDTATAHNPWGLRPSRTVWAHNPEEALELAKRLMTTTALGRCSDFKVKEV